MYATLGYEVDYVPRVTPRYYEWLGHAKFFIPCGVVKKPSRFKKEQPRSDCPDREFVSYLSRHGMESYLSRCTHRVTKANRSATYKDLLKYDRDPLITYDRACMQDAWDSVFQTIRSLGKFPILDTFESIYALMNKTKSPGYPYNLKYARKGDIPLDHLKTMYDLFIARLRSGDSVTLCTSVAKGDEMRTLEKIADNLLRVFMTVAIDALMAQIKYCAHFNQAIIYSYDCTPIWIGASKFHRNWDILYRRLDRHPCAYALDESAFDATLNPVFLRNMCALRKKMTFPVGDSTPVLDYIYDDIIESIVVTYDGDLVQKPGGNPSGSYNTIVDNSVVLLSLFYYAWFRLAPKNMRSLQAFRQHVELAICGDDNVWTTSREVEPWFNAVSVTTIWRSVGVLAKYGVEKARPLSSLEFVSNHFYLHPVLQLYVPRPKFEKLFSSMVYASSFPDNLKWSVLRACYLRYDGFWDPEFNRIMTEFIEETIMANPSVFNSHFKGEKAPDNVSGFEVTQLFVSEFSLSALYLGTEAQDERQAQLLYDWVVDVIFKSQ